jgi:DNA repair protein RadC
MTKNELLVRGVGGNVEPASKDQILEAGMKILAARVRRGASLNSPRSVREFLIMKLGHLNHEIFAVIFLDRRHRVIEYTELFRGTIDGANVYPREVVKAAMEKGAASVVLVHNHPSGVQEQSTADELITKRLQSALALIDVRVLDHLIIAGCDVLSFAERGLL